MMKDQRRAGTMLSYLYIVVNTLTVLVYQKIILATLGESEYGLYQLAASIINYMSVMDLGFNNGIVNYTAKYRATGRDADVKKLHGMFMMIFYGIGFVAVIIGTILTLNVENFFAASMTAAEIEKSKVIMAVLTVNMGLTFALSIYNAIIIACERFIFTKILTIIRSLLNPLIMLPLLLVGGDSITMVIVLSGVNVFCLFMNLFYSRYRLGIKVRFCGFDRTIFKEIFSYSIYIFLAEIVDKVNWSVDQIILGVVSGTKQVAVYSVAATYNQLVTSLSGCVSSVMLPGIAAMVARNEGDKKLNALFIKSSRIQIYTILMVFCGFALVGKSFVLWHAGDECGNAYYVALILMGGALIPITQSVAIAIIKAKDKFKFRAILLFLMSVANVGISIPLAMAFGSIGSAVGTAFALLVANVLIINIYYHKTCGIDMVRYWKTFLSMTVRFVPSIAAVWALKTVLPLKGMADVLVYGALFVVLYCITAYFFVMNSFEKELTKKYLRKIFRFI
ncbi:MAG: oligosaccharide flippase family protein [Clostridia bacterium]|nr:oligosaccharide flippase family protein [Clostridia bacterium]